MKIIPGVPKIIPPFNENDGNKHFDVVRKIEDAYDIRNINISIDSIDLTEVPFPGVKIIVYDDYEYNSIPVNPNSTWIDLIKQIDDAHGDPADHNNLVDIYRMKNPLYLGFQME